MSKKARILIVEDNETNLMIFEDILVAAGHEVFSARSAEESFQMARTRSPDLILMDIQLPGMDGLDAVGVLKNDPSTSSVPIIALTAHAMEGHREKALKAGCSDYITKPIRISEFRERVQSFLQRDDADSSGTPIC